MSKLGHGHAVVLTVVAVVGCRHGMTSTTATDSRWSTAGAGTGDATARRSIGFEGS